MYSLRRTLAVRFSLTIFFALLLIALWAYLGAQRILREELDRGLAASAHIEKDALAAGFPIAEHSEPVDLAQFIETVNRFVVVRTSMGAVVSANAPLSTSLPLDTASFARAVAGQQVWVTQEWGDHRVRCFYWAAQVRDHAQPVVIQVAASLTPLAAANREVLFLLLGTVLLGTVASWLGAGWLADSSVDPVVEITEQASRIGPAETGRRITEHADIEEFAGLIAVLNGMLDRLDRAFETQRRMIADAGHDLKTPLTAMRGELEVALRGDRHPDEYRAILTSVLEEVDHLASLSNSLVLLARLDAGTLVPERIERDVAALAERAAGSARGRCGEREIHFCSADHDAVAPVDAQMLGVALDHLLDNGIKHTPEGTKVLLGVAVDAIPVRALLPQRRGPLPRRRSGAGSHRGRGDRRRARRDDRGRPQHPRRPGYHPPTAAGCSSRILSRFPAVLHISATAPSLRVMARFM
jgi:signal transduction histidine kinase